MRTLKSLSEKISNYIDVTWGWFFTNGMKQDSRKERLDKLKKENKR